MMRVLKTFALAAAFAVAFSGPVLAQSAGSISGRVTDGSGGALPGAAVTIANPASAVSQSVTTDSRGAFVSPPLPPGTYSVAIELAGFKRFEKSQVIVSTASRSSLGDLALEIGDMKETVTVAADTGRLQIQSESAERSDLVTNTQLRDIALNGRNIVDLMKTVPGVIAGNNVTTSTVVNLTSGFNINGTRNDQHEYTVDGVTNLNLGNNTGALVTINPDAVEEIKVLTSNYQAEYGKAGGGFIALTTRSGTNEFHGGARYFRRHDSLNANNYFNNARGGSEEGSPRPLYRFNYYGYDIGGPVPFVGAPGERKLFFFWSQEYYDQLVPEAPRNRRVPTELERRGDFSQTRDGLGNLVTIRDPLTGQAFPGNIIPPNRFYSGGPSILNVFPLPNTTAGNNQYNYTSQEPSEYPRREDILRMDWQVASSTRLSGRFIYNKDEQRFSYGTTTAAWDWPLTITTRKNGPGKTFSLTLTHTFSPSLINELTYGAGRGGVNIGPEDDRASRDVLGLQTPLLFPDANDGNAIPSLNFDGNFGANNAVVNQNFAETAFNGTPFRQTFQINNFIDNLTKVSGRHTFKAGIYYQRANNQRTSFGPVQANIDFANNASHPLNTGHPYSNALLGIYNEYSQASVKLDNNFFYQNIEGYIQDTWKVRPGLTLDYGLRVSHYQPIYDKEDQLGFFDPALFDPSRAPRIYQAVCVGAAPCASGAARRAIDPSVSAAPSLANTLPGNFIGRLVPGTGNATNGMSRVVDGGPQGGFESPAVLWGPRLGAAWDVTGDGKTVIRGGFGITYDRIRTDVIADAITNPPSVSQPTLYFGTLQQLEGAGGSGTLGIPTVVGMDPNGKLPTVYTYSAGVQRDLGSGITLDVAYVGSTSRNNPRQRNLNSLPYGTTFQANAQDPTRFPGGVVPAVEPGLPAAHQQAGLAFSGQFALPIDFLRPYQGYGDILYRSFDGKASYNSLQAAVRRRFTKSLSFGVSYTLSRARSTSDVYNANTHVTDYEEYDWALATFDRTHYLVANYVWQVPKGSGLLGGGAIARGLLDNWTLSGISWYASGNPAELALSISGQDAGNRILGSYSAGNSAAQQPRFYVDGDPNDLNSYRVPAIGDVGPYSRYYLRNPGINNHDLSLFKNFPFGAKGNRFLQFRLEMFNVLNHPQFSGVNRSTNVTTPAQATGAAVFNSYSDLSVIPRTAVRPDGDVRPLGTFFGEENAARDPRIIQLGVKLYF